MSDRRTTSSIRRAKVVRPGLLSPPPQTDDDTDENTPALGVPSMPAEGRTMTPSHEALQSIVTSLLDSDDAAVPAQYREALRAVAERVSEDRAYFELQLERMAAPVPILPRPWGRMIAVLKGVGISSAFGGVVFVASGLMARGAAEERTAAQVRYVKDLGSSVERLQKDLREGLDSMRKETQFELGDLRAQAAGHHALLQVLAARLSAAADPR